MPLRFGLVTVLLVFGGLLPQAATAQEDPQDVDRVMGLVHFLLEKEHISGKKVDDTVSRVAMQAYIRALDPMKLYFEQDDLDAVAKFEDKLDDMIQHGDLRFARLLFTRFVKRLELRVMQLEKILEMEHDWTVQESFVTEPDDTTWAKSPEDAADRWRKRVKYDLLRLKADDVVGDEAKEQLRKRFKNFLRRMKQFDDEEILSAFLAAITSAYDPHTRYIGAKPFEDLQIRMRLNYQGIGAHLQDQDGVVVITDIIPGGAAAKYGQLKDGDRILGVGQGESGDIVDIAGMKLSDVVKLIRGEEGTLVRLQIRQKGGKEVKIHDMMRARIELRDESAIGEVMEIDGSRIGIIDLPSFYRDTDAEAKGDPDFRSSTRDVAKYLEGFKKRKIDAVVLDLRYNGGGLLTEAIELTGLFIDTGPVVQIKDGNDKVRSRDDKDAGMLWSGPIVILTSRFSASASEILAGAIQDYGRGIVVGDPSTHGKGTVQHVIDLGRIVTRKGKPPALGGLKLTLQKFYRASGDSTQLKGVHPDIVLPALSSLVDGEAELPQALSFDQIPALPHDQYGHTKPNIVNPVREASGKRIAASEPFTKIKKDVERFRKLRKLSEIPLEEAAFSVLMDDQEESEQATEEANKSADGLRQIKRDDYLEEVLRIANDYARSMKSSA
ncbi:MAG: carboxy terminal-processing peptidase [Planctomycetota bacterium]|nr:carboxy terminal-processing peptidase [Planctomycetota bacterium]